MLNKYSFEGIHIVLEKNTLEKEDAWLKNNIKQLNIILHSNKNQIKNWKNSTQKYNLKNKQPKKPKRNKKCSEAMWRKV